MFVKQLILATWVQQRNFASRTHLFQRFLLSSKICQLVLQGGHLELQLPPALLFTFELGLCLLRGFLELWDITTERLAAEPGLRGIGYPGCSSRAAPHGLPIWPQEHPALTPFGTTSLTSKRSIRSRTNSPTNPCSFLCASPSLHTKLKGSF